MFRFTIRKEPAWNDPRHGYHLELIVGFWNKTTKCASASGTAIMSNIRASRKNLRWKLDELFFNG